MRVLHGGFQSCGGQSEPHGEVRASSTGRSSEFIAQRVAHVPALSIAPRAAMAPNWMALTPANDPRKEPTGVRAAEAITTS